MTKDQRMMMNQMEMTTKVLRAVVVRQAVEVPQGDPNVDALVHQEMKERSAKETVARCRKGHALQRKKERKHRGNVCIAIQKMVSS